MNGNKLKLMAQDGEDIEVIATVLQDAIAPLCDMTFQQDAKTFIMVVHRFCWAECEKCAPEETEKHCFERVCCAVRVSGVSAVQSMGIDHGQCNQMLDLLTVQADGQALQFIFAGDARIKLTLLDWKLKLEDFGAPWPTTHQPCHERG